MRTKLMLDLEDLIVDSFDTTAPQKARGTVYGEQCTCYTQCTCPGCPTCDATCPATCNATCPYTCDDVSCAASCACSGEDTCDPVCYAVSLKYTNCNTPVTEACTARAPQRLSR